MGHGRRQRSQGGRNRKLAPLSANFHWTESAWRNTDPREPWVVFAIEQRPQEISQIAFTQADAARLLESLAKSLASQGCPAGKQVLDVLAGSSSKSTAPAQP